MSESGAAEKPLIDVNAEIEAKYVVPNAGIFERLLSLEKIGEYSLKEPATKAIADHYLDSASGSILRGGFACRLRHNILRDAWVGTLKGLGNAEGAVHTRTEHETPIPPNAPPDRWPSSPACDLALSLSQSQPLRELFIIHQTRHIRLICLRDLRIAELSLDEVVFEIGERRTKSLELEIELAETGTLNDLRAMDDALAEYGLQPEPRSKFERGLALLKS
ncbi:MAG TPA: CYTH domain-containing protein [Anaerolineales bacterium]|nr:CYTH domain-containing protein [Anaerolineales bacterium]